MKSYLICIHLPPDMQVKQNFMLSSLSSCGLSSLAEAPPNYPEQASHVFSTWKRTAEIVKEMKSKGCQFDMQKTFYKGEVQYQIIIKQVENHKITYLANKNYFVIDSNGKLKFKFKLNLLVPSFLEAWQKFKGAYFADNIQALLDEYLTTEGGALKISSTVYFVPPKGITQLKKVQRLISLLRTNVEDCNMIGFEIDKTEFNSKNVAKLKKIIDN